MMEEKKENSTIQNGNEVSGEEVWSIIFAYKWSPGEFCWIKSNGNRVVLLRPGDYIDHERFEKFRSGNMNLVFKSSVDISYMEAGINIFEELQLAAEIKGDKEEKKNSIRNKYLKWCAPYLWNGDEKVTLLEMISLFTRVFYKLDHSSHLTFSNLPIPLQQRSLSLSSMICSTALIVGHTDFRFLQDLFHLGLFFDYSLADESYSYLFEDVLEKERIEPGAGEKALDEQRMHHKTNVLKFHPEQSALKAEELLEGVIYNKNLFKIIELHHETLEGKGFPKSLNVNDLNDLEKIIVACSKTMPQKVDLLKDNKEEKLIYKYLIEGLENEILFSRIKSQIVSSFNSIGDDEDYVEVVGL
jgi:hypothetical protein